MVNGNLSEVVCSISSGTTTTHKVDGAYAVYGSTGPIGYTENPDYFGEKILVARVGANAGTTNIVSGAYGVSDNTLIVEVKPICETKYVFYSLKYAKLNQLVFGSGQPLITGSLLKSVELYIPDKESQKQIADILSDIDGFILTVEKQIEKKKVIKQGAMQDLLTGKKRLPGFSGEWINFNLMKHSKIKARIGWQGLKKSEYLDSGYALLITGTDFDDGKVKWDSCHYVTRSRYDQDRNIQIQNNDILITKDGSLGKAALVQGLTKPATLNSGIFVIRPMQNAYDPVFVYHILSSFVFKDFLDKLSAGSTIIHLYQKDICKFEFLLPPTIEEQEAIAALLSEMDSEIETLQQKLEKYRQLKQGMMQQLLTGKIRLV